MTHKVGSNPKDMETFYADKNNYGKYFVDGEEMDKVYVPFVIFIPLAAAKKTTSRIKQKCPMSAMRSSRRIYSVGAWS